MFGLVFYILYTNRKIIKEQFYEIISLFLNPYFKKNIFKAIISIIIRLIRKKNI